jgi:hypothetical protein
MTPSVTIKSGIPPIPTMEIERLLSDSAPTIWRHIAIIITLGNNQAFSGVFAKSFGYEGILTAAHSAIQFLANDNIALAVAEEGHRFIVKSTDFDHVPIGYDEAEGYTSDQPDLSFVVIKNEQLLQIIRDQKLSFYDLDIAAVGVNEALLNPEKPFARFNWSVGGCPRGKIEIANKIIGGREREIITNHSALIQGSLVDWYSDSVNNFDYLKLYMGSGFEEFPDDYDGMSGGGIWYQRFLTDNGINFTVKPILAGVVRWQSEESVKDGYKIRCITGHAWVSIYAHVRRVLAEKRGAENRS